jgi:transposase InsO family protein
MDVAVAFLQGWLSRYGLPSDISSDRGAQFTSDLWADLTTLLGTKLHHTTAYHPQSNGLVERFHCRIKDSLKAKCQVSSWSIELAWTMLGIQTTLKEDLGTTSAELVFGEQLTVPREFVGHGQGEPVPALV